MVEHNEERHKKIKKKILGSKVKVKAKDKDKDKDKEKDKKKINQINEQLNKNEVELSPTIKRWIQLLRSFKLRQLKKNIDNEISTYEINKTINDKLLLFLNEELEEKEISEKIDELKNSKIDILFNLHKENVNNLQKKFEKDILQIFKDYEEDEVMLLKHKSHLVYNINKIYERINEEKRQAKKIIEQEEKYMLDEIYTNYIAEKYIMNYNVDKFKEDIETFNNILLENKKALDEESENYNAIKTKFEKNKKCLHSKKREAHDLQLNIDNWKLKLENEVNIYESQIEKLRNEKTLLLNHIRAIKLILQKLKHNDKQRLTDISINSNNCLNKLEENIALANNLINFNNLCKKYETDREKHFTTINIKTNENKDLEKKEKEYMDSLKKKCQNNFSIFENFFKRQNKVILDLMILKKQLQERKKKNETYKKMIADLKNKYDTHQKVQLKKEDFVVKAS